PGRRPSIHDGDGPVPTQEGGDPLQGPLGGRKADPLDGVTGPSFQPLQGEGQLDPPLAPRQLVDLVDDDGPDGLEHLPGPGREQEGQEGFGGGDEDLGRVTYQSTS